MADAKDFLMGAGALKKAAGPLAPPPTPKSPSGIDVSREAAAHAKRQLDAQAKAKQAQVGPTKRYKQLIPSKH